jgi:hypothetical protein
VFHGLDALLQYAAAQARAASEQQWGDAAQTAPGAGPEASEDGLRFSEEAVQQNPQASSGQGSFFHNPYSSPTQTSGQGWPQQPTFPPPPDDEASPYGPG